MYTGGFLFDTPIMIAATEEHVCTPLVSIVFDTLNLDYSKSGIIINPQYHHMRCRRGV